MKLITASVSKHSSRDRSYAHDVWELLGQNDHHWFVKCLTKSFSWAEHPVILLEKQYYDIFDVPKNISDVVIADYQKRNPVQDSVCEKAVANRQLARATSWRSGRSPERSPTNAGLTRPKDNHAKTPRCNATPRDLGCCAIAASPVLVSGSEFCCRHKSLMANDLLAIPSQFHYRHL
jgi:hypothetical protein